MKISKVNCTNKPQVLMIGRQLENNYRQFEFDCSLFGDDIESITLVHQRKNDVAPYQVTTSNTDILTWTVSGTDTAYSGYGKAELRIVFSDGLAKSAVYTTFVMESITADSVIPEPLQSWYDAMIDYIDENSITEDDLADAIADYISEHPISAPVTSVNGEIGDVVLTASDVGALPDSTVIPTVPSNVSAFTNDAGYLTSVPSEYVTDTEMDTVLANYAEKSEIPTKTSDLTNDSGFITSVPVSSVNGKTGAVNLTASDVGALPSNTQIPSKTSDLQNDSGFLTSAVTSFNGNTGAVTYSAPVTSVNGMTGAVTVPDTNTTYTISISGNVITLTPSSGQAQSITLPVYQGGVI